jgi:Ca2+-binding EF-hand superfamily protein
MDGKLDNSEMTQVNIDFPLIFTYGADSNYDYTYSYSEIYAALKRQYNPFTSMIVAKPMINSTIPIGNEMSAEERKLQQYGKWVLSNYDSNKDGQLDENEAQKLWSDIANYDYSGEIMAQVGQVQTWIAKFDTDRNGKLTIGELLQALSQIA